MVKSIKILLVIVTCHDYAIWKMDVKAIFINWNLQEEVYMTPLEGFELKQDTNKVCKLRKSIYRIKQVLRSWNICFDEIIR